MLRTWLKKHWLPLLLLAAFLYLAIGATAPFFHYKTIPDKTKEQFSTKAFYQDGPGVDRAMILETNESAWARREPSLSAGGSSRSGREAARAA